MMKMIITGERGTGKTAITATIARLLARDGYRALLIDADPRMGLAAMLGARRRLLAAPAAGPDAAIDDIIRQRTVPAGDGASLLATHTLQASAGCHYPAPVLVKRLVDGTQSLRAEHDFVIVDSKAGHTLLTPGSAAAYDCHLAVTVAERSAIETAREAIELARELGISRQIVAVNKTRHSGDIVRVMEELDVSLDDIFPLAYDGDMACAGREGRPVAGDAPGSGFVGDIRQIVGDITLGDR